MISPSRVIPAAESKAVMREQLEFLMEHAEANCSDSECRDCKRYWLVGAALLEIFTERG